MRAARHNARFVLPLAFGFGCLILSLWAGPIVTWILLIVGFGLMFEGATALFARATSGGGGLPDHRQ